MAAADLPTDDEDGPTLPDPGGSLAAWEATLAANRAVADPTATLRMDTVAVTARDEGIPRRKLIETDRGPPGDADFALAGELGRGGMGVVYLAEQTAMQRRVAVKMLLKSHPRARRSFITEGQLTGFLEHPNIVPVYELGQAGDGRLYMAMKLVRGKSLKSLLRQEPADSPERLRRYVEILKAVCDAIGFAHSHGVLHRDLKASNVMVGAFGEVQVMDWGLALRQDELDASGRSFAPAGTPAYMAPEQAAGRPEQLGPHTDVYLLGAMLYEILTGGAPHRGESVIETLATALEGVVEAPSARVPARTLPRDLERLALAALARDPARRPASAADFRDALAQHLVHADARGLLDRARALVEAPATEAPAARRRALERARVLLEQARELYPAAPEAAELAARAQVEQAELALDLADGAGAAEALRGLAPTADVAPARIEALQQATRRVRARRRNQTIAAALLGLLALALPGLWQREVRARLAAEDRLREARATLPGRTDAAWESWRAGGALDAEALRALTEVLGPPSEGAPDDLSSLRLAHGWRALRFGEWAQAARQLRALRPGDSAFVAAWEAARVGAPLPAWQAEGTTGALGRALLLATAAAPLGTAAPDSLRTALASSGARAVLADLRSGCPDALLFAPDAAARPRFTVRGEGEARQLVVYDGVGGPELWRFPPPAWTSEAGAVHSPLLLAGAEGDRLLVASGPELLTFDPRRGTVLSRLPLPHDRPAAVLPRGAEGVLVVQRAHAGRARSRLLRATLEGWLDPPALGAWMREASFHRQNLERWLAEGVTAELADSARVAAEGARLEALAAFDPGHPLLPFARGLRAASRGQPAVAESCLAQVPAQLLSPGHLAVLAERCDAAGLADAADTLLVRAGERQEQLAINRGLNPLLTLQPAFLARKLSTAAMERGEEGRALRRLDRSRTLAIALEGDRMMLPLERRWYRARGDTARLHALEPYAAAADKLGGLLLTPMALVELFDLVLVLMAVLPFLLLIALGLAWWRARPARLADLHRLGFRGLRDRLMAFVTHPMLRLSHCTLAYCGRAGRLGLIVGCVFLFLLASLMTMLIGNLQRVAEVPISVGVGAAHHPTLREYLLAAAADRPVAETAAHQRLLIEGELSAGALEAARDRLEALLRAAPEDPFALNNRAWLHERAGDRAAALPLYRRAAATPGEPGAVARHNLARLAGEPLPPLPVVYSAGRTGPVRQLARPDDLLAALGLSDSPGRLFLQHLRSGAGLRPLLIAFGLEGGSDLSSIDPLLGLASRLSTSGLVGALLLLALITLLYLPFPPRPRERLPSPRARRRVLRESRLANLLWPGALWLGQGRPVRGVALMLLTPALAMLWRIGSEGGLFVALALPSLPFPFAGDGVVPGLVSESMASLRPWIGAALALLYAGAWLHGVVGFVRRRRAG